MRLADRNPNSHHRLVSVKTTPLQPNCPHRSSETGSPLKRIGQVHQTAFAEVTPPQLVCSGNVAVTVRISGAEADIHSGADAATVEMVLRILKSC